MQKAIENFIDVQLENKVSFDAIENEIDKVEEAALQKAKRKQRIEWRRSGK